MSKYLATGLSTDPAASDYGCTILSDFDLFFNSVTDEDLARTIRQRGVFVDVDQLLTLKKQRRNLKCFINKMRTNIIDMMELPEKPDPNEIIDKKRKTKDDVIDEINNTLEEQRNKNLKTFIYDEDDEYDEFNSTNINDNRNINNNLNSNKNTNINTNNKNLNDNSSNSIPAKYASSRWGPVSRNLPQDLYITNNKTLSLLDDFLLKDRPNGTVFYDPCCGTGVIGNHIRAFNHSFKVIERDLYTTDEKVDYLRSTDPEYDVLVANFPFCIKLACFNKAIKSGKLF